MPSHLLPRKEDSMMTTGDRIMETAAEVEALLIRSINELFAAVIFPNYGKVTSDGVTLGPTWWSQKLEAQGIIMTVHAIESRVSRWRQKSRSETDAGLAYEPDYYQRDAVRRAKRAITDNPELASTLIEDPETRRALNRAAFDHDIQQAKQRTQRTERIEKQDPIGQRIDNLKTVTELGEVCERFSRDGNEALRKIGDLPESERFWLTGSIDRAEATVRAARRYLELGRSEIDAELRNLVENGG